MFFLETGTQPEKRRNHAEIVQNRGPEIHINVPRLTHGRFQHPDIGGKQGNDLLRTPFLLDCLHDILGTEFHRGQHLPDFQVNVLGHPRPFLLEKIQELGGEKTHLLLGISQLFLVPLALNQLPHTVHKKVELAQIGIIVIDRLVRHRCKRYDSTFMKDGNAQKSCQARMGIRQQSVGFTGRNGIPDQRLALPDNSGPKTSFPDEVPGGRISLAQPDGISRLDVACELGFIFIQESHEPYPAPR